MRIEIAAPAKMSESGSSLLRLIQNTDMPLLDLLVRESIQNSLDAALPKKGPVNVSFDINPFNPVLLASELEEISEKITCRYADTACQALIIRDCNTFGLTGPLHHDKVVGNDYGNLLKLVYEISRPQQTEGSGGSWGLGKTVYFRVGVGLVMYYSRTKDEQGNYCSRLAACLVEDEQKDSALIPKLENRTNRGIAWWGDQYKNETIPVTNSKEIKEILSIFNVHEYQGEDTGTTVIIPFIDSKKLLRDALPENNIGDEFSPTSYWWLEDIASYINVAIQRWYAPRLLNPSYKYGRWLQASINGQPIKSEEMVPFFRIVQYLYNKASDVRNPLPSVHWDEDKINIASINLNDTFTTDICAGNVAYAKFDRNELLMNHPHNNPAPYCHIRQYDFDQEVNKPIIMYSRKPGMIVCYETAGHWTDGIQKTVDGEYLIGFFVANSNNKIKDATPNLTLEEYIRKREKADHASWHDGNVDGVNKKIVQKVQNHVTKKINATYEQKDNQGVAYRKMGLSRALASFLLPPENFGHVASVGPTKDPTGSGLTTPKGTYIKVIGNPKFENQKIIIDFELQCKNGLRQDKIELVVRTEAGGITGDKWESDEIIGTPFPILINSIEFLKYRRGRQPATITFKNFRLDKEIIETKEGDFSMLYCFTESNGVPYGIKLNHPKDSSYTLTGRIILDSSDGNLEAGLIVAQPEGGTK